MAEWGFYGRRSELAEIERLVKREQFFFCSISGRRRIGKTSLIEQVLKRQGKSRAAMYVQIPDSDERGVISAFEDVSEEFFNDMNFAQEICQSFRDISLMLYVLWKREQIVAIDEFQYFHRKSISEFLSHLQRQIDRIRSEKFGGGLFALGSIHTEMTAVIEDKTSPLFNRVTDNIHVGHWDMATLFEMFREHGVNDPMHRLFLWSIFEGVPKFYRDCFDHNVLLESEGHRRETLKRMFFEGSSPLKDEAENWFLRELRGRYDSVLKLVARLGPCSYGQLKNEYDRTGTKDDRQLSTYLQTLNEKYQMVEKLSPVFALEKGRKTRYQISDNFLRAWLSSIEKNVQLARVRPVDERILKTDEALMANEGFAFEKMIRLALEECSRKKVGDYSLTHIVKGYWNKPDGSDIEIDIVAINEDDKIVRVGSCKRSQFSHSDSDLAIFNGHIERFKRTELGRKYKDWKLEKALYSPLFDKETRSSLESKGYICTDLNDFERWLM